MYKNDELLDLFCYAINKRIKTMDYSEEKAVREHLYNCSTDGFFNPNFVNGSDISDILNVNEECIQNVLEDFIKNTLN